jgi:hypothetical protein
MTGDGVLPIDDWNRQLGGRAAVITGGGAGIVAVHSVEGMRRYPKDPVDGGTKAGGGWLFSPREGRFVNRWKHL